MTPDTPGFYIDLGKKKKESSEQESSTPRESDVPQLDFAGISTILPSKTDSFPSPVTEVTPPPPLSPEILPQPTSTSAQSTIAPAATAENEQFLPAGLPSLPPPVLGPSSSKPDSSTTSSTPAGTQPPTETAPPPSAETVAVSNSALPNVSESPSSDEAFSFPKTDEQDNQQTTEKPSSQPPREESVQQPIITNESPLQDQRDIDPVPVQAQAVLISRDNPPRLTALLFPTSALFVLLYGIMTLIAEMGVIDIGRWRILAAIGIAITLWMMIFNSIRSSWQYPDLLPDWYINSFNAVTRRTGIAMLDRTGVATCIALGIFAIFISPWVACLCFAGAIGFVGSVLQPVVLWPVGWTPLDPYVSESPAKTNDSVIPQSFEWILERGLGIGSQASGMFTINIDQARYEMLVAESEQKAKEIQSWRAYSEWMLTRGNTDEVIRIAIALSNMRKEEKLTDFEDIANALSFIHQCFTIEEQTTLMWRSPLATLQERRGTSIDLSVLLVTILRQLGRPCLLLYNPKDMHMAVAVAGASGFPRNLGFVMEGERAYFYCETVQRNWLPGEVPTSIDLKKHERYRVPSMTDEERVTGLPST